RPGLNVQLPSVVGLAEQLSQEAATGGALLAHVEQPNLALGVDVARVELGGLPEVPDGPVDVARLLEQHPAVEDGALVAGLALDDLVEPPDLVAVVVASLAFGEARGWPLVLGLHPGQQSQVLGLIRI